MERLQLPIVGIVLIPGMKGKNCLPLHFTWRRALNSSNKYTIPHVEDKEETFHLSIKKRYLEKVQETNCRGKQEGKENLEFPLATTQISGS